jgi:hypothetical protein
MLKKILFLLLVSFSIQAQELNARVEINAQALKSTIQYPPSLFQEMKSQIERMHFNYYINAIYFTECFWRECSISSD